MSGTSVDGIDAVLVSFDEQTHRVTLAGTHEAEFPNTIRAMILHAIAHYDHCTSAQLEELDLALAECYADAVHALLQNTSMGAASITAIGCHGQTIQHQPDIPQPFTHQLGNGKYLAQLTGIDTVNDFRSADMALGGQGAPLAPIFHHWAFDEDVPIAIVNIGGIANITELLPDAEVRGYDTGPGNILMDTWCQQQLNERFDHDGRWSASGVVNQELLLAMLQEPYFAQPAPKSTGRELFNSSWLNRIQESTGINEAPENIQTTLTELTAQTIANAIRSMSAERAYICGGGALNGDLMKRLQGHMGATQVLSTAKLGIPPEWLEAIAFAWFASARIRGQAVGIPAVTGASEPALLGVIHKAVAI